MSEEASLTPIDQTNKFLTIVTPLATDALGLIRIRGSQAISAGFQYELDMFSDDPNLVFSDIVGSRVTITIHDYKQDNPIEYPINGIVAAFEQGHRGEQMEQGFGDRTAYHATIVPWSWVLGKKTNNRIFQDKNVPDIIDQVFQDFGDGHYELDLQGSYDPRTYCVQYNETDLNFVSRLMEEEGIFYYFKHEDGKHTMVLSDSSTKPNLCPNLEDPVEFTTRTGETDERNVIHQLTCTRRIIPNRYTHRDYNFITPQEPITTSVDTAKTDENDQTLNRELYDYPGKFENSDAGDNYSKLRMEVEEVEVTTLKGAGNCIAFTSGYHFTLTNFGRDDLNEKDYLLVAMSFDASQGWEAFGIDGVDHYDNTFTCIPIETPFRPRRKSFRPKIHGVQTAKVVGPAGEEIYTDDYGRIKVQFHWDREGASNEESSCWIRVAQMMSGPGWGGIFIPRMGQEVIVEFLEGDPDRPLITGCVYHAHNMPPYPLPAEKTKSTFKSDSSIGGDGFNEIRFEDLKGEEEVFLHAERNLEIRVGSTRHESIGWDRHLKVENDKFEHIKNDRHEKVENNHIEEILVDRNLKVEGNQTVAISGSASLSVGGDLDEVIKGDHNEKVSGNLSLKGSGNIVLDSASNITLKVGGSFIAIDSSGIKIKGTQVVIEASMAKIDGKTVDINGSAMVTIKGGAVKIN